MSTRNLDMIFNPRRIAVIGASSRRGSVGATVLHNLTTSAFIQVVATTEWTSSRMLATFRHFGFALTDDPAEGVVCVMKQIA